MGWWVYALSGDVRDYIYVGLTTDLERRVGQHNSGKERTTKAYRPFSLLFTEEFKTRAAARGGEKHLKSGHGKDFLRRMRRERLKNNSE